MKMQSVTILLHNNWQRASFATLAYVGIIHYSYIQNHYSTTVLFLKTHYKFVRFQHGQSEI